MRGLRRKMRNLHIRTVVVPIVFAVPFAPARSLPSLDGTSLDDHDAGGLPNFREASFHKSTSEKAAQTGCALSVKSLTAFTSSLGWAHERRVDAGSNPGCARITSGRAAPSVDLWANDSAGKSTLGLGRPSTSRVWERICLNTDVGMLLKRPS